MDIEQTNKRHNKSKRDKKPKVDKDKLNKQKSSHPGV